MRKNLNRPVLLDLKKDTDYYWCRCTSGQLLCTQNCKAGMHYYSPISETVIFCNCKQSNNPPFCDGSHRDIN